MSPGQIINGTYSARCLEMSLCAGAQSVAFALSLPVLAVTCSSPACFLLPTELPNARASTSKSGAACWYAMALSSLSLPSLAVLVFSPCAEGRDGPWEQLLLSGIRAGAPAQPRPCPGSWDRGFLLAGSAWLPSR